MGGDWLDICLLSGRDELIRNCIDAFQLASPKSEIFLFTYLGPLIHEFGDFLAFIAVTGLCVPINAIGMGMVPSKERCLDWIWSQNLPLIGLHCLGQGIIPPVAALDFVWNHAKANIAVVGASKLSHVEKLVAGAKQAEKN